MPEPVFDTAQLAENDIKIKELIDDLTSDGNCDCGSKNQLLAEKILVIREGLSLDIQLNDLAEATKKQEIIGNLIRQGSNCSC